MNENNLISQIILIGHYSFYLELYFAMLIILCHAKKRNYFVLRAILGGIIGFPCYWLPSLAIGDFNYTYLTVMLMLIPVGVFLYKEKIFPILFSVVGAWALQHVTWNLLAIIYDIIPNISYMPQISVFMIYLMVFILFYLCSFILFFSLNLKISYNKTQLLSFVFASIVILAAMYLSQAITEWNIILRAYTLLVAFLSLVILIGYPYLSDLIMKEKELANEKLNLEQMLSMQAEQQKLSKEATDVLNMKFHDMKNQIIAMKNMNEHDRQENAQELEKSIDIYSDIAKTGNEAMDIVITQKSLLCTSKKIRFTYMLDGKSCSFMNKSDITSLFGNILDNAIEGCDHEEGEFRIIKMRTFQQKDFLVIQQENYCHHKVTFGKDGLPISSKMDTVYHGYGTKSIKYIVEKYNGQMEMKQEDDIFHLSILIPILQSSLGE